MTKYRNNMSLGALAAVVIFAPKALILRVTQDNSALLAPALSRLR